MIHAELVRQWEAETAHWRELVQDKQNEIERLRDALRPFADYYSIAMAASGFGPNVITDDTPIVPMPSDQSGADPLKVQHLHHARDLLIGTHSVGQVRSVAE
jgi:hypothetical protein